MKVAVYHNLPPGGALRVLSEFLGRTNREHEYDLYTVDLGQLDGFKYARSRARYHDLGASVSRAFRYPVMAPTTAKRMTGAPWLATAPRWMARVERRIASDINAGGYDVALVYSCHISHTPSLLRWLEVPSMYYMNEPRRKSFEAGYSRGDVPQPLGRRAFKAISEHELRARDRTAVAAADRIATNSCYSAECIQRAYARDAAVCYLGIDTATFDLEAGEAGSTDRPSVISVGALDPVKGHDLVVRSLGVLPPASRPSLELVYERFDPAYRAEIEGLAAAEGVDLRLHSGIDDGELARLYRAASVSIVAARLEPFGLVPLESLACGTPVVALREGGYRETVEDEVNGLLVDRSPVEMAQAINRLLTVGLGRTRADLRSTVVPKWDWDQAVKRQLDLLALAADECRR